MRHALAIPFLAVVISASSPTHAMTISVAKIDKGAVQVKGKRATPLALLTWEGQAVAQATKSGSFRFETAALPQNCTGTLSDGNQSVAVVIQYCGPVGPRGPQGNPGPAGQCFQSPANPTPTPGTGGTTQDVNFNFIAANGIQAFQVRIAYPTAKGSFTGTAENVDCIITGGGGIFSKYDNNAAGTLTLSVANTSNLTFPINIACTFEPISPITPSDLTVSVQEVTQNNGPGNISDLTASVSVP